MSRGGTLTAAAAVLADAAAMLLSFWLLPWFTGRFQAPSPLNAALIVGLYLAFCLAVYLLRRYGAVSANTVAGTVATALAVLFGILVAHMAASSSGFSVDTLMELDLTGLAGSLLTIAALMAALLLVFGYMLVLVVPVRPAEPQLGWVPLGQRLLMLLATDLMLIASVGHWEALFADAVPYVGLSAGAQGLVFLGVYAFFVLFYGGPRLLLSRGGAGPVPVITFLLQTAYYVWGFLSGTAW